VPAETVSVFPLAAVPVIVGCTAETSGAPAAAIGPTRLAYALVLPVPCVALTVSPSV
jgi:hypothetical protein